MGEISVILTCSLLTDYQGRGGGVREGGGEEQCRRGEEEGEEGRRKIGEKMTVVEARMGEVDEGEGMWMEEREERRVEGEGSIKS